MTLTLSEYAAEMQAKYCREIDDGWVISVIPMRFSDRVCIGRLEWPASYEDGWCYPDRAAALQAAQEWDGEGDPRDGWIKHIGSNRCRVNGDPQRESIGWPPQRLTSE